jgi:2'-5' RNA ligase
VVPAALTELRRRLTVSLSAAGVPFDERPFVPHVTLARKAEGPATTGLAPIRWRSAGHVLAVSAGGRYGVAGRFA